MYSEKEKKFFSPYDDDRYEKPAQFGLPAYGISGRQFMDKVRGGGKAYGRRRLMPSFSESELSDLDVGLIIFYVNYLKAENASRAGGGKK